MSQLLLRAAAAARAPETLDPRAIRRDGGTQSRTRIDEDTVNEYAAAMVAGVDFPAITAYYDGAEYWLADGFHRVAAWLRAHPVGTPIPADVRQGSRRDAILHGVGANDAHGLRRTPADKHRAIRCLLEDEEWGKWSDREIARRCNVHHEMVGKLRMIHTGGNASMNPTARTFTHHKTGQPTTMQTANIGKRPEPEAPAPSTRDSLMAAAQAGQSKSLAETPATAITGSKVDRLYAAIDTAQAWLSDYRNENGVTWRGLSDNQVHHANSPCYAAFVAAHPEIEHPKEALASALVSLRKQASQPPAAAVTTDADRHRQTIQTAVEDCQRILSRPAYLDAIKHASRETQQEHDLQIAGLRHMLYLITK